MTAVLRSITQVHLYIIDVLVCEQDGSYNRRQKQRKHQRLELKIILNTKLHDDHLCEVSVKYLK